MEYQTIPWPYPWMGLVDEIHAKHNPPESLVTCTNLYYVRADLLRTRGGWTEVFAPDGAGSIMRMYYWDYDDNLYIADDAGKLWKNTTAITGPSQNVVDMVSFGTSATPTLYVAETIGAQDHTLHTYTGSAYADLSGTGVPLAERLMVRLERLWGTTASDEPSHVYASSPSDATEWVSAWNTASEIPVAPGEGGAIQDWLDYDQKLFIFKERGHYVIEGDMPANFRTTRLSHETGMQPRTAADAVKGVMYTTDHGVFPLGRNYQGEVHDLTRNVEQSIEAHLTGCVTAFSVEMNAYLIGKSNTTTIWVSSVANRPDVWTKFTAPANVSSIYQGPNLYIGCTNGKVYRYDSNTFKDDATVFTVALKTGDWNFGDDLIRKNVRFVEGHFNASQTAACSVAFYKDGSGSAVKTEALVAAATQRIETSYRCNRTALGFTYTTLTAPVYVGPWIVKLRPVGRAE